MARKGDRSLGVTPFNKRFTIHTVLGVGCLDNDAANFILILPPRKAFQGMDKRPRRSEILHRVLFDEFKNGTHRQCPVRGEFQFRA